MGVVNDSNPWRIPHMPHHQIKGCFQKVSVTLPTKILTLALTLTQKFLKKFSMIKKAVYMQKS